MSMSDDKPGGGREITGRHVLIGFLAAFGVVLVVNLTMMFLAISGFPGLVSKSPYTEGQRFDAQQKAERALGWSIGADWAAGRLAIRVDEAAGGPVAGVTVRATVGRPASDAYDVPLELTPEGGVHVAAIDLGAGVWRVAIEAERAADGARFVIVDDLFIRESEATR